MIMHLPFVNLGTISQPDNFDAHHFETLCLQHTLYRLVNSPVESWTILDVSPMELDRQSFIFKILLQLKELIEMCPWSMGARKV